MTQSKRKTFKHPKERTFPARYRRKTMPRTLTGAMTVAKIVGSRPSIEEETRVSLYEQKKLSGERLNDAVPVGKF